MTEDIHKQLARATGHARPLSLHHCRHYNGVFPLTKARTCDAGVRYMKLNPGPVREGWMGKLPCLRKNETDIRCKRRSFMTDEEELEAEEAAIDWSAHIDATLKMIPLIHADADSKGIRSGTIMCPLCEGPLHYSISGKRNRIHASCRTPGCLSFME